mmetsp:Transcript_27454/g.26525  ORF Transcript_27454/g.26525 Transcript_27454/m.26525 type:complete len:211 (-) Transcript_27454:407-1039(-)
MGWCVICSPRNSKRSVTSSKVSNCRGLKGLEFSFSTKLKVVMAKADTYSSLFIELSFPFRAVAFESKSTYSIIMARRYVVLVGSLKATGADTLVISCPRWFLMKDQIPIFFLGSLRKGKVSLHSLTTPLTCSFNSSSMPGLMSSPCSWSLLSSRILSTSSFLWLSSLRSFPFLLGLTTKLYLPAFTNDPFFVEDLSRSSPALSCFSSEVV